MTKHEVIERYAAQKKNPRQDGKVAWKNGNIFCDGTAIYSYGRHFQMAQRLGLGANGEAVHLLNGDRYSVSTGRHQSLVRAQCPGFTVPFSALNAAKVWPSTVTLRDVLDRTPDETVYLERDTVKSPWKEQSSQKLFEPRMIGEIVVYDSKLSGYFHAPGAALIRHGKRRLLATSDEGTYCIMELQGQPQTVTEAFEGLRPAPVIAAMFEGLTVQRQGEWFFVPCAPPEGRAVAKQAALPRRNEAGNLHVCVMLEKEGALYCRGSVYHRNERGVASRQHRALRLGATWHRAYRNTEVASWQTAGKVD